MKVAARIRSWAKRIKRDGLTLWFAIKHPTTPWHAKALGMFVVGYALSPIDLIPDFIPVLGYLDDVILLPGLIWLTVRLIPTSVLEECRARADEWMASSQARPVSRYGALGIALVWMLFAGGLAWFIIR
jgi:uncharacterized membrane protein YkvA (DUF1232 family)